MLHSRDRGSVTAETAVALPALVLVAALIGWLVAALAAEIRCVDAARVAARSLARGDPPAGAVAIASRAAPRGARVAVRLEGGQVRVEVRARVGPGIAGLPAVPVGASALAPLEGALP